MRPLVQLALHLQLGTLALLLHLPGVALLLEKCALLAEHVPLRDHRFLQQGRLAANIMLQRG